MQRFTTRRCACSSVPDHASQMAIARRLLTAKAVREAAFKYNGVPDFCEFLAALPANVSVFDPKLGRTRTLVQGGRVIRKNVTWLRKRKKACLKSNEPSIAIFVSTDFCSVQNWIANVTIPISTRIVFLVSSVIGRECCIWRGDLSRLKRP